MKNAHAALARLVERRLAIRIGPERPHDTVTRWVRERTRVLGLAGPEAYVEMLSRNSADAPEFVALVRQVTNGQTYFFRDVDQLEVALTLLAKQNRGSPRQVYLPACSTGEEPYSLLMMAIERGIDVQIFATDINDERLATATAGVYSPASVAKIPPRFRQRFVEPHGVDFRISAAVRDRVRFERRNLLDSSIPRPALESRWDLILCRNVFIYFGPDQIRDITRAFASVLAPDGTLVLGSSETLRGLDVPFESTMIGPRTVYRHPRPDADRNRGSSLPPRANLPTSSMILAIERAERPTSAPEEQAGWSPRAAAPLRAPARSDARLGAAAREWLERGHAHLREHAFDDAEACYAAAIRVDDLHPEGHFFRGLVACKRGASALAVDCFRRALFLEPSMWPARMLLAGALERIRDSRGLLRELEALEASLARATTGWEFESDASGIASATITPNEARNVVAMRRQSRARASG